MTTLHLTHFITNESCQLCNKEMYENDTVYTLKQAHDTVLSSYFCSTKCFDYSIDNYSFLLNCSIKKVKIQYDISYYYNLTKFMLCDLYYPKVIMYDCGGNNLKILEYIYNIQATKNKTDWEKSFIHNCLKYNLLKIEKII